MGRKNRKRVRRSSGNAVIPKRNGLISKAPKERLASQKTRLQMMLAEGVVQDLAAHSGVPEQVLVGEEEFDSESEHVDVDGLGSEGDYPPGQALPPEDLPDPYSQPRAAPGGTEATLGSSPTSDSDSKSDIFDGGCYDMAPAYMSAVAEYDGGLLAGGDPATRLLVPKQDGLLGQPLIQISTSASSLLAGHQAALSLGVTPQTLGSLPSPSQGGLNGTVCGVAGPPSARGLDGGGGSGGLGGAGLSASAATVSPLVVSTSLLGQQHHLHQHQHHHHVGGGAATATAFAQVTRIEPGPEQKGYVLHLAIPALGLSDVMLSAPGLSLTQGAGDERQVAPPCGDLTAGLMGVSGGLQLTGAALQRVHLPSVVETMSNGIHRGAGLDPALASAGGSDGEESPLYDGAHSRISFEGQLAESDDLCRGSSPALSTSGREDLDDGLLDPDDSVLNITGWMEKPEVDRFVICSDGPMECVLCAFKTDSYSAFKSHIICSHPCWRITKKLSKNRLLVEKSVKMNINLVPSNLFQLPRDARKCPTDKDKESGDSSPGSSSGGSSVGSGNSSGGGGNSGAGGKCRKQAQQHQLQRRKAMLERNKRLFRCSVCLRLFVFEGSIVNHLIDNHGVKKPYDVIQVSNDHGKNFGKIHRCSHKNCYASCTSEEELERHRLESHAQVVYRCQICGFTANSAEAVKSHATRIHHQQVLMYGLMD